MNKIRIQFKKRLPVLGLMVMTAGVDMACTVAGQPLGFWPAGKLLWENNNFMKAAGQYGLWAACLWSVGMCLIWYFLVVAVSAKNYRLGSVLAGLKAIDNIFGVLSWIPFLKVLYGTAFPWMIVVWILSALAFWTLSKK